jgi:glycosyltransferase involved in cell wall biosynthesis
MRMGGRVRIVIDIRYRTRSGAVSYLQNLTPHLLRSGSRHEFVVLREEGQPIPGGLQAEAIEVPRQSAAAQALHDQFILPGVLRRAGADAYHPLKYLGTMRPGCTQVTTVHAITEDYLGTFPVSPCEAVYWKVMGRRIMRASATLIAVSGFIRDFLIERIQIHPDRIVVVPNGVDPLFRRLASTHSRGADAVADAPYLLVVGNVFPVKNQAMAVRAFAEVAAQHPTLRLKLAGATHHPYCGEVRALAASVGVLDRVDFLGYVETAGLVQLMKQAELLLMPSLTEGCPITLLEAMTCGTPVIASGRGGIPEVAGAAAAIVEDPNDIQAWSTEVASLLQDRSRQARYGAAALERQRQFTWQRTAEATLAVYDALEGAEARPRRSFGRHVRIGTGTAPFPLRRAV